MRAERVFSSAAIFPNCPAWPHFIPRNRALRQGRCYFPSYPRAHFTLCLVPVLGPPPPLNAGGRFYSTLPPSNAHIFNLVTFITDSWMDDPSATATHSSRPLSPSVHEYSILKATPRMRLDVIQQYRFSSFEAWLPLPFGICPYRHRSTSQSK